MMECYYLILLQIVSLLDSALMKRKIPVQLRDMYVKYVPNIKYANSLYILCCVSLPAGGSQRKPTACTCNSAGRCSASTSASCSAASGCGSLERMWRTGFAEH